MMKFRWVNFALIALLLTQVLLNTGARHQDRAVRRAQYSSSGYDTDAQTFFTTAGITDTTQKAAVNQLVLDLKANSLWTKMVAVYPFVGGDATKHSFNLKNPSLYQLTFVANGGSWTHNATLGASSSGGAYATTGLNVNSVLAVNDQHLAAGIRSTDLSSLNAALIGAENFYAHKMQVFGNQWYSVLSLPQDIIANYTNTTITDFWMVSRNGTASLNMLRNGSVIGSLSTDTSTSGGVANATFYISAINNGGPQSICSCNFSYVSIGAGMNTIQASTYNTIYGTFKAAMGR